MNSIIKKKNKNKKNKNKKNKNKKSGGIGGNKYEWNY